MSPDEMSERLAEWAAHCEQCRVLGLPPCGDGWRRVVCVEPDGPRRTWVLTEGGRQVGHVRGRCVIDIAQRQFGGDDGVFHTAGVQSAIAGKSGDLPWPSHVEALLKHRSITPLKGGCHWRHDGREFDSLPWTWEASDRTRAILGLDSAPQSRQTAPEEGSQ